MRAAKGWYIGTNLLEVLVVPYRSGDRLLAGKYEALLRQSRGVHDADISRDHLRVAARLRAATGVKTPVSLQVVAAWAAGCTAFPTFRPYPVSVSCNCPPTLGLLSGGSVRPDDPGARRL
jgi:hypothetical protein